MDWNYCVLNVHVHRKMKEQNLAKWIFLRRLIYRDFHERKLVEHFDDDWEWLKSYQSDILYIIQSIEQHRWKESRDWDHRTFSRGESFRISLVKCIYRCMHHDHEWKLVDFLDVHPRKYQHWRKKNDQDWEGDFNAYQSVKTRRLGIKNRSYSSTATINEKNVCVFSSVNSLLPSICFVICTLPGRLARI